MENNLKNNLEGKIQIGYLNKYTLQVEVDNKSIDFIIEKLLLLKNETGLSSLKCDSKTGYSMGIMTQGSLNVVISHRDKDLACIKTKRLFLMKKSSKITLEGRLKLQYLNKSTIYIEVDNKSIDFLIDTLLLLKNEEGLHHLDYDSNTCYSLGTMTKDSISLILNNRDKYTIE